MTYPWWFQALVAFGMPFFSTLAASRDWIFAAASGFGGLVGLGVNKTIKKARKG